jgi:hypothetical protein
MFIIRESFTAKPGQASKLAKLFKEVITDNPQVQARAKSRIMTDSVASFNTVVMETEVKDLAEFESMMKEYMSRSDVRDRMKGYTEMYVTGKREIYQLI